MSNAEQLTNMLLAKELPNDDESSAIRNLRLTNSNLIAVAFQWEWLGLGIRVSKANYLDSLGLAGRRIEDITEALIKIGYATLGRGGYHHCGADASKADYL